MQKILFYQKRKPKTADGLWMHKDSDGNMKIDYVGNNKVYPVTSGGGTSTEGYNPVLSITPSAALIAARDEGLVFSNTADAAQALGISEQDFSKLFIYKMSTFLVDQNAAVVYNLTNIDLEGTEESRSYEFTYRNPSGRIIISSFIDTEEVTSYPGTRVYAIQMFNAGGNGGLG